MTDTPFPLFQKGSNKPGLKCTAQSPSLRVPAGMIQEYDDLVQRTQVPEYHVKSESEVSAEMVVWFCKSANTSPLHFLSILISKLALYNIRQYSHHVS